MKIAFVYDRATKIGGAERILQALHDIWPEAPLFTAFHYRAGAIWTKNWKVIPSFLQSIPYAERNHELFPWATPLAFGTFDLSQYDVVLSVTSAEAKSVIVKPAAIHICYCLTPTRYLWSHHAEYRTVFLSTPVGHAMSRVYDVLIKIMKEWDLIASQRPDYYIAISHHVRKRIEKYYGIKARSIVYPPVDTAVFKPGRYGRKRGKYYLLISRAVQYKRLDIVVKAFNVLNLPLMVITEGNTRKQLERISGNNITFITGNLTDAELARYYQKCLAFVYAGNEDFGLVAAEAQSCGKPVIAYKRSGMAEIVNHGRTGILYEPQTVTGLISAVRKFQTQMFDPDECIKNADRFSLNNFKQKMKKTVNELVFGR